MIVKRWIPSVIKVMKSYSIDLEYTKKKIETKSIVHHGKKLSMLYIVLFLLYLFDFFDVITF